MKYSHIFVVILSVLIFFSCEDFPISSINPQPEYQLGDTIWMHECPAKDSTRIGHSLAIGKDGTIYYSASGGTLWWHPAIIYAINKDDGSIKWISEPMDHIDISSNIVVGDDGTVYAIGYYTLYAFDPDNGNTKWTWEVPETVPHPDYPNGLYTHEQIGALALTDNGDLILGSIGSGAYTRCLFGVDKNGNTKWHNIDANGWGIRSGIFIGPNNTAFYYSDLYVENVGSVESLIAVNAATGDILWHIPVSQVTSSINTIAIMDDGKLFCSFAKEGETIRQSHIVDNANGNIIWSGSTGTPSNHYSRLIGPDGSFYNAHLGLHEVDKSNGAESLIKNGEFGAITENNRILGAYTADWVRKLGSFYPDGLENFSVDMNGLMGHELVVSDDKVIYGIVNLHPVSRLPYTIVAIQGDSPLAKNGWPKKSHDNQNTSNWSK